MIQRALARSFCRLNFCLRLKGTVLFLDFHAALPRRIVYSFIKQWLVIEPTTLFGAYQCVAGTNITNESE